MANNKKMTMKYWNSLEEGSRYRALRKIFFNFSDSINHDYAKREAKELYPFWDMVVRHAKIPADNSHYKTVVDRTYIP